MCKRIYIPWLSCAHCTTKSVLVRSVKPSCLVSRPGHSIVTMSLGDVILSDLGVDSQCLRLWRCDIARMNYIGKMEIAHSSMLSSSRQDDTVDCCVNGLVLWTLAPSVTTSINKRASLGRLL